MRWRKVWLKARQRRDGTTFQVCYRDDAGRMVYPRSFHARGPAEACRSAWELWLNGEADEPEGLRGQPDAPRTVNGQEDALRRPWEATLEAWLDTRPARSRTKADYRARIAAFAQSAGIVHLEDVTEELVGGFLAGLLARGCSQAYIGGHLRYLACFLRSVNLEPCPVTKRLMATWKPYKCRRRERPHIFTAEELEAMLAACEDVARVRRSDRSSTWWRALISLLWECGLRMGEAANLLWRDLELGKGELTIQPHTNLRGVLPWQPKGIARRSLPMSADLVKRLVDLQTETGDGGPPYVFVSAERYRVLMAHGAGKTGQLLHGVRSGFVKLLQRAGIEGACIHDLRKSFVTRWCLKLSPGEVQVLAGHESVQTTMVCYNTVTNSQVAERVRGMMNAESSDSPPHTERIGRSGP